MRFFPCMPTRSVYSSVTCPFLRKAMFGPSATGRVSTILRERISSFRWGHAWPTRQRWRRRGGARLNCTRWWQRQFLVISAVGRRCWSPRRPLRSYLRGRLLVEARPRWNGSKQGGGKQGGDKQGGGKQGGGKQGGGKQGGGKHGAGWGKGGKSNAWTSPGRETEQPGDA